MRRLGRLRRARLPKLSRLIRLELYEGLVERFGREGEGKD